MCLGGVTLHRTFGIQFGSSECPPLGEKKRAEVRKHLANLKLIIIDEISMVSAQILYNINRRLSEIFQTNELTEPFANINTILVGDLMQLPPVKGTPVFKTIEISSIEKGTDEEFRLSAFADDPLWDRFEPMILKHNHRQGEGNAYANALNEFREGIVTEENEALLKTRETTEKFLDDDSMHVCYKNDDVNDHNDKMLATLDSPMITLKAHQKIPKGFISYTDKNKGTIGGTAFMDTLNLKIGARCMLIHNINVLDNLVNGSTGKIVGFETNSKNLVECVIMKFDDESWGIEQRAKYYELAKKYKQFNGTPIFKVENEYQTTSKKGWTQPAKATLYQFPLKLSWAQTAHKMQVILPF